MTGEAEILENLGSALNLISSESSDAVIRGLRPFEKELGTFLQSNSSDSGTSFLEGSSLCKTYLQKSPQTVELFRCLRLFSKPALYDAKVVSRILLVLSQFILVLRKSTDETFSGQAICSTLWTSHHKDIYSLLSSSDFKLKIVALKVLKQISAFDVDSALSILRSFDFDHEGFAKLPLSRSGQSNPVRHFYISWVLSSLRHENAELTVLAFSKRLFCSRVIKYIGCDPMNTVHGILNVFTTLFSIQGVPGNVKYSFLSDSIINSLLEVAKNDPNRSTAVLQFIRSICFNGNTSKQKQQLLLRILHNIKVPYTQELTEFTSTLLDLHPDLSQTYLEGIQSAFEPRQSFRWFLNMKWWMSLIHRIKAVKYPKSWSSSFWNQGILSDNDLIVVCTLKCLRTVLKWSPNASQVPKIDTLVLLKRKLDQRRDINGKTEQLFKNVLKTLESYIQAFPHSATDAIPAVHRLQTAFLHSSDELKVQILSVIRICPGIMFSSNLSTQSLRQRVSDLVSSKAIDETELSARDFTLRQLTSGKNRLVTLSQSILIENLLLLPELLDGTEFLDILTLLQGVDEIVSLFFFHVLEMFTLSFTKDAKMSLLGIWRNFLSGSEASPHYGTLTAFADAVEHRIAENPRKKRKSGNAGAVWDVLDQFDPVSEELSRFMVKRMGFTAVNWNVLDGAVDEHSVMYQCLVHHLLERSMDTPNDFSVYKAAPLSFMEVLLGLGMEERVKCLSHSIDLIGKPFAFIRLLDATVKVSVDMHIALLYISKRLEHLNCHKSMSLLYSKFPFLQENVPLVPMDSSSEEEISHYIESSLLIPDFIDVDVISMSRSICTAVLHVSMVREECLVHVDDTHVSGLSKMLFLVTDTSALNGVQFLSMFDSTKLLLLKEVIHSEKNADPFLYSSLCQLLMDTRIENEELSDVLMDSLVGYSKTCGSPHLELTLKCLSICIESYPKPVYYQKVVEIVLLHIQNSETSAESIDQFMSLIDLIPFFPETPVPPEIVDLISSCHSLVQLNALKVVQKIITSSNCTDEIIHCLFHHYTGRMTQSDLIIYDILSIHSSLTPSTQKAYHQKYNTVLRQTSSFLLQQGPFDSNYDPRFMLPLIFSVLDHPGRMSIPVFIEKGFLEYSLLSLCLSEKTQREMAYRIVCTVFDRISPEQGVPRSTPHFKQKPEVWMIMYLLQCSIDGIDEFPRISRLVLSFFTVALKHLMNPSSSLYALISQQLLRPKLPGVNLEDIPLWFPLFFGDEGMESEHAIDKAKSFLFEFISNGVESSLDVFIMKKRNAFFAFMDYISSSQCSNMEHKAITKILAHSLKVPRAFHELVRDHGFCVWLTSLLFVTHWKDQQMSSAIELLNCVIVNMNEHGFQNTIIPQLGPFLQVLLNHPCFPDYIDEGDFSDVASIFRCVDCSILFESRSSQLLESLLKRLERGFDSDAFYLTTKVLFPLQDANQLFFTLVDSFLRNPCPDNGFHLVNWIMHQFSLENGAYLTLSPNHEILELISIYIYLIKSYIPQNYQTMHMLNTFFAKLEPSLGNSIDNSPIAVLAFARTVFSHFNQSTSLPSIDA